MILYMCWLISLDFTLFKGSLSKKILKYRMRPYLRSIKRITRLAIWFERKLLLLILCSKYFDYVNRKFIPKLHRLGVFCTKLKTIRLCTPRSLTFQFFRIDYFSCHVYCLTETKCPKCNYWQKLDFLPKKTNLLLTDNSIFQLIYQSIYSGGL